MCDELDHLLKGVSEGGVEALAELYLRYSGTVLHTLRRMKVPESAVEDVAQDVFFNCCQVMRRGETNFNSPAALKAYFRRAAFNSAVTYHRKNQAALVPLEDHDERRQPPELVAADDPEREAAFYEAWGKLTPEEREIIYLKEVEGLTHAEIARRRGVEEATSKNQLWAAKRRFALLYLHPET